MTNMRKSSNQRDPFPMFRAPSAASQLKLAQLINGSGGPVLCLVDRKKSQKWNYGKWTYSTYCTQWTAKQAYTTGNG